MKSRMVLWCGGFQGSLRKTQVTWKSKAFSFMHLFCTAWLIYSVDGICSEIISLRSIIREKIPRLLFNPLLLVGQAYPEFTVIGVRVIGTINLSIRCFLTGTATQEANPLTVINNKWCLRYKVGFPMSLKIPYASLSYREYTIKMPLRLWSCHWVY